MRVKMLCPVAIVGREQEDGTHADDATYDRDAEYDVNDTLGETMVASGQAVELDPADDNLIGFVNPLPEPKTKKVSDPPENK
jgi:hypothetical protein